MKKTEVMFFFDTEDFTSNRSADAIKGLADLMTSEGITGHFAVVGLLARQLKEWGRSDVIESLKPHIIGTHTYGHSLHPDICEQSDFENFDEAFQTVAEYEDQALAYIKAVLNPKNVLFACPPGNSKSYVSMYYYAERGIPFYCDTVVTNTRNSALHYCNQEHIGYSRSLEGMFLNEAYPDLDIDAYLDEISEKKDRVIIYTHPNMSVKKEFWDKLNYDKGNFCKFGQWKQASDRTQEDTNVFWNKVRTLVQKIKKDDRLQITNLKELLDKRKERQPLTPEMLSEIRSQLEKNFSPINEPSFSIADIFCAATHFLCGKTEYVPDKVFGFFSTPYGVKTPCEVTREAIIKAAAKINTATFIPEKIQIGNTLIGPADYLFAALEVLTSDKDTITIVPKTQLNDITDFEELETFQLKDTWIHTPELEDCYLSDRLRLQCWTLRN